MSFKNFSYNKEGEIGKTYTPSEWRDKPSYQPITRLRISCGGGIGGASWFEYVERAKQIPSNQMQEFVRYDGKKIKINTSYVVDAEDFILATAELDISEWKLASNDYRKDNIQKFYVLLDEGVELNLV